MHSLPAGVCECASELLPCTQFGAHTCIHQEGAWGREDRAMPGCVCNKAQEERTWVSTLLEAALTDFNDRAALFALLPAFLGLALVLVHDGNTDGLLLARVLFILAFRSHVRVRLLEKKYQLK